MKLNLLRTCLAAGALAVFALACRDEPTVAPKVATAPGAKPTYDQFVPFNDNGATGVTDTDSDHCGDLSAHAANAIDLGTLEVVCTAGGTGFLHVGSCIGWTVSGGDKVCPSATGRTPANGGSAALVDASGNVI